MGLSLRRMQTSNTSVGLSQATLKLVPGAPAELEKARSGPLRKKDTQRTGLGDPSDNTKSTKPSHFYCNHSSQG